MKDLFRIMSEYSLGVEKEELGAMYKDATRDKKDFLMIDMDADTQERFRKNFNDIYDLEE
jgi:hypothetical protein